ncbi:hypothetical protein [Paraburkholderia tropica]|uniref:hypothetical protein n=1 Tax=Paraburkholderia tropica TaxID=92647 RepID=UPI002AAF717F|nr:hypothetical protein [Paraburkholderia tropica]
MNDDMLSAKIDKPSYVPGEAFTLQIFADSNSPAFSDSSNVSFNAELVKRERNHFGFGFGTTPLIRDGAVTVSQKIPINAQEGVYLINGITLNEFNDGSHQIKCIRHTPIFFVIRNQDDRDIDDRELAQIVRDLELRRTEYMRAEIRTSNANSNEGVACRVLVFGVGCLLHSRQQMEGISITPLKRGFSHQRLHDIVDTTLTELGIGTLKFDPVIEAQYESATPTFLIDYGHVVGKDPSDALLYCQKHSELIFVLLGLNRGHKPRAFYSVAIDTLTGNASTDSFRSPHYRGNYLADFDAGMSAALIESAIPKLEANPFLRLIVRSFAEATAEVDPNIALLRSWTVLELLSGRSVTRDIPIFDASGTAILNKRGNPKTTSAAEGRVYQYIMDNNPAPWVMSDTVDGVQRTFLLGSESDNPNATPGSIHVSVWDVVRAAYAIRNCVAHEGYFSESEVDTNNDDQVLAAHLIRNTPLDPKKWVREMAEQAVHRALNNA